MSKIYELNEQEELINEIQLNTSSDYENLLAKFKSNPKKFLEDYNKSLREQANIKIDKVEFQSNNENYETLSEYVIDLLQNNTALEVNEGLIHSIIQTKNLCILRIHNSTTISCIDGSHLRFCPYKDGIEISRIYVPEELQGEGNGSALMMLFLSYICESLSGIPNLVLECVGAVGLGDTRQSNSISNQTRFFRKFGFRVSRDESHYPTYVKMKAELTIMDMIEITMKFCRANKSKFENLESVTVSEE